MARSLLYCNPGRCRVIPVLGCYLSHVVDAMIEAQYWAADALARLGDIPLGNGHLCVKPRPLKLVQA